MFRKSLIIPSTLLMAFLITSGFLRAAAPVPTVDLRETLRRGAVVSLDGEGVVISGTVATNVAVTVEVTDAHGSSHRVQPKVELGKFSCRYPADFPGATQLTPGMLYVDAFTGQNVLKERGEALLIVAGNEPSMKPDLPAAFYDDFVDGEGRKDMAASTWSAHRQLMNRYMTSRGARLTGIGREGFDLALERDFKTAREKLTLYDFDHRDRDWSTPQGNRPARTFWQAEWNTWFGPGNNHPWDGNPSNLQRSNFRPYTFTNDLADLIILQQMRRSLPRAGKDNRDAMAREALENLLSLQYRGEGTFAADEGRGKVENYTNGAFRYGLFETGEWLKEGTGWFANSEAFDHRHGGVFNGRAAWALGESLKRDASGDLSKRTADALALVLKFCLHDGIGSKYTRVVNGLPFWRQSGEHGYLTLGMLAAAEVMPDMPVTLDPAKPPLALDQITVNALDALVAARNRDLHWTKYPDQDAMGLAALARGAMLFPNHPHAAVWKQALSEVADGWLGAKHDPAERISDCVHFGRREGKMMTYRVGGRPDVHINLYITGLWLHALAESYSLTGNQAYRERAEGIMAYLCGDNPFHARLLSEIGAVYNVVLDTDDESSRIRWDCYPESTAFVQIGLLHWLVAISKKP